MNKIKVNLELYNALESASSSFTKEELLDYHSKNKLGWLHDSRKALNYLSNFELAELLIKGYEVEESSQEIVEKVFNNLPDSEKDIYYKSGILFALNAYGIKIKGIND